MQLKEESILKDEQIENYERRFDILREEVRL